MKFQKFHLNRIKYLILILLYVAFIPSVKAIVSPTNEFYVNDYANILSSETEEYILNRSIALNNIDGTQIVVVTVPNLEGMSLEDYSLTLARNFKIGSSKKDNGLLLLLALEEREFRVEVGAGLEGILPDGKTGRFQDEYIIPYLRDNNWNEGIINGYDAFYKEIVTLNNLNIDYSEPNVIDNDQYYDFFVIVLLFSFAIGAICGFIIKASKNKNKLTIIYLIIWGALTLYLFFRFSIYLICMIINIFLFLVFRFGSSTSGGSNYSGRSSYSSRSSSYSSRSSGGGGSFRGGGSSRRF